MRSRVMVRKVDRLPAHFPIFEDLATPVGLMNKLEPNAKITRIVAHASTNKKIEDESYVTDVLDGYEKFEVDGTGGQTGRFILDGLDEDQKKIEQTFRIKDVAKDLDDGGMFPEMEINHIDYIRPAPNCEICEINGIGQFVVTQENCDPGRVIADGNPRQPPDLCK